MLLHCVLKMNRVLLSPLLDFIHSLLPLERTGDAIWNLDVCDLDTSVSQVRFEVGWYMVIGYWRSFWTVTEIGVNLPWSRPMTNTNTLPLVDMIL